MRRRRGVRAMEDHRFHALRLNLAARTECYKVKRARFVLDLLGDVFCDGGRDALRCRPYDCSITTSAIHHVTPFEMGEADAGSRWA